MTGGVVAVRRRGERIVEPRVVADVAPLIEEARKRVIGGYEKLARALGISKTTLLDYRSGRALMPISIYLMLKQIIGEAPDSPRTLPPYWGQIRGGIKSGEKSRLSRSRAQIMARKSHASREAKKKKLIPELAKELIEFKPTFLAEFIGRMLGDGSISLFPKYYSSERESHFRMQRLVKELFGFEPKTLRRERYFETRLRRICIQVLNELNIPIGKKSLTNPNVPEFIMTSESEEVLRAFICGYFDDEACVSKSGIEVSASARISDKKLCERLRNAFRGKSSVSMRLAEKMVGEFEPPKSHLLKDVKSLLHKLGIRAQLKCMRVLFGKTSVSVEWKLIIRGKDFQKALENNIISPWKLRKLQICSTGPDRPSIGPSLCEDDSQPA